MKQSIIIILLIITSLTDVHAQSNWELKKDDDGIKVYTGTLPNSNIKAIKAECILNASLSQLTALLLDAKAHEQWVYSVETSYVVKKINEHELVYYSEMSMPWPLENRDVVIGLNITQDANTKVMYVSANTTPGYVPVKDNKIRVSLSKVQWEVTAIGGNRIKVEYVAEADPGGSVPVWAVNTFSAKGTFETFKKLKETLASGAYRNARFDYIRD